MIYYPKEPTQPYVDRPNFRRDVLTLIQSGLTKHILLGDTHAIYGTGKTTALAKLFYELKAAAAPDAPEELKALRDRTPIWLPLDGFSISYTNVLIQDLDSLAALEKNLDNFKKLLDSLGREIDPLAFDGLADQLENITGELSKDILSINVQAQGGNVDVGTLTKIVESHLGGGDVHVEVKVENWEIILHLALKSKIPRFTQEFLKIYKSIDQQKKFVLIADDFGWIIDHPIGDWFLDLVRQMDNLVTLLSRTVTDRNLNWDSNQIVSLTLPPFSREEVRQYMLQRELDLSDAQIEKVYQFSKAGHPLLVSLAGDLLARLDRRESQDVDIVLDRLVGKPKGDQKKIINPNPIELEDLTKQIDNILNELRNDIKNYDPKLLDGLNVITLARKFDYNLLKFMFRRTLLDRKEEVWDEDKAEEEAQRLAHEMILRVPEYAVVQEVEDRDLKNSVYRVQYIVRSRMEANLMNSEPPEHIQRIHNQLIDYYQGKETENMKAEAEYTAMFRLEHADWQKDIIEWLYHLFCLEDRNRARLMLCKFFLEAFDWWGWYIAFNFCDDLCNDFLIQWGETQPAEDQKVVRLLLSFLNAYPTGYEKHGKGDWKTTLISLNNLLATLKLNLTPAQMNSDQRMVRAHLDRYIADGYRFSTVPNFQLAEASYNSSRKYFDVRWNQAWIVNFLADLNLDWMSQLEAAGKTNEAQEKAAAAENSAMEANQMAFEAENYLDQDHELMSQNYRILGSVYLQQSDCARAFQAFALSIAHAYIFHFLEDNQDEYSFQFYIDTGAQVLQALDSLVKQGRLDDAREACQSLRGFWEQHAPFFAEAILSALPHDFDLEAALSSGQAGSLRQYIQPVIPEVGTEGDPIDTGVTVSQTIADGIRLPGQTL